MDRREPMPVSGSPYYIQRGIAELHGTQQAAIRPIPNSNMSFQPNIGGNASSTGLMAEPTHTQSILAEVNMSNSAGQPTGVVVRKKRGRPRKYGPDGSVSLALSSSPPIPRNTGNPSGKRGRGRPPGSGRKQQQHISGSSIVAASKEVATLNGAGFTPHVITIAAGEDIGGKIMSFARQGHNRAVCVMAVSGSVSSVTLRQASSGGTITYEGRFDILHMSGSFIVADTDNTSGAGGLSISLVSPEGRVIGGGVGGMVIAASPVQVILGSFIRASSKTKHNKVERQVVNTVAVAVGGGDRGTLGGADEMEPRLGGDTATASIQQPQHQRCEAQTPTSSSIGLGGGGSGWPSPQGVEEMQNSHFDIDLMHG